ncbi:MAG: hypothetical protein MJA29_00610, partial [Candidatus Omnitrophica bacterium]|nr:hypothetical protein [Candidatus Omnitrophota bacterium]
SAVFLPDSSGYNRYLLSFKNNDDDLICTKICQPPSPGSGDIYIYTLAVFDFYLADWVGTVRVSETRVLLYYRYSTQWWCRALIRDETGWNTWLDRHDTSNGLNRFVPYYGDNCSFEWKHLIFQFSGIKSGCYRLVKYYFNDRDVPVNIISRIAPQCPPVAEPGERPSGRLIIVRSTFNLTENEDVSVEQLNAYSGLIHRIFDDNCDEPQSIKTYLKEAYYFVQVHIAIQLQRQGHYVSALDWLRTVYDYRAPMDQRKISYVLEREESLSEDYERFAGWLLDPLNPHEIAVGRTETYTRFTLLSLVRCLLDYADAEFTLDTAESVPRARTLYTTALELLDCEPLKQPEDRCAELLGDLTIEIEAAIEASAPELMPHRDAIMRELGHIADEEALTDAVDRVRVVLRTDRPIYERLIQAADIASEVKPRPPETLAILALEQQKRLPESYSVMLAQPTVAKAAEAVGSSIGDRILSVHKMSGGIHTANKKEVVFYEANFGSEVEEDVTGSEVPLEMGGMDPYQPSLSYNFC